MICLKMLGKGLPWLGRGRNTVFRISRYRCEDSVDGGSNNRAYPR